MSDNVDVWILENKDKDNGWWTVEQFLPETQKIVIIRYKNHWGAMRSTIGFYCRATEVISDCDEHDNDVYSVEKDEYFIDEGWYDQSMEAEYYFRISNVTHWMEMPRPPQSEGILNPGTEIDVKE